MSRSLPFTMSIVSLDSTFMVMVMPVKVFTKTCIEEEVLRDGAGALPNSDAAALDAASVIVLLYQYSK